MIEPPVFGPSEELEDPLAYLFKRAPKEQMMEMLHEIADLGGVCTVEMLESAGYNQYIIKGALGKPGSPHLLAPYLIHDLRVVTLTNRGWKRVGKPWMREAKPNPAEIVSLLTPPRVVSHIRNTYRSIPSWHNLCRVTATNSQESILEWRQGVMSRAWDVINAQSGAGMEIGMMTHIYGPPQPDAVITEEWAQKSLVGESEPWVGLGKWDSAPTDQVVEITLLLEVETATKNTLSLEDKVRRLNTAISLGAAEAVIWATDDLAVATRLWRHVTAQDPVNGPTRHRFVPLNTIDGTGGLPSSVPQGSLGWWLPQQ